MFYSHEVLTSRRYGVATIWLVATLGQKSGLRKVSRKAVLDVNVSKACEVIIAPQVPMALRLTANLLYGVSRVYNQQCDYFLSDAQHVHTSMRTMFKVMHANALAPESSRANFQALNLEALGNLFHDKESQLSNLQLQSQSPVGLQYSVSDDSGGAPFPKRDSSRLSGQGATGLLGDFGGNDGILDDAGIEIDIETGEIIQPRDTPIPRGPAHRDGLSSEARRQVREDHLAASRRSEGYEAPVFQDIDMPLAFDLPDADAPLPIGEDTANPSSDRFAMPQEGEEHSSSSAPLRQRQPRNRKELPFDRDLELHTTDLREFHEQYCHNMETANRQSLLHKVPSQARKNAHWWILGQGLNGVRYGIGASKTESPLAMFAGNALLAWVTGQASDQVLSGQKRSSEELDDREHRGDLQRPRLAEDGPQIGRGADDDGIQFGEDGTEMGRAAEAGEHDDVSSAMPWNISASHRGSSVSRGRGSAMLLSGRASATPQNINPATAALIQALTGRAIQPPLLFADNEPHSDRAASDIGAPYGDGSGSDHGLPMGDDEQIAAQQQQRRP